jgi:hypothetical protein
MNHKELRHSRSYWFASANCRVELCSGGGARVKKGQSACLEIDALANDYSSASYAGPVLNINPVMLSRTGLNGLLTPSITFVAVAMT